MQDQSQETGVATAPSPEGNQAATDAEALNKWQAVDPHPADKVIATTMKQEQEANQVAQTPEAMAQAQAANPQSTETTQWLNKENGSSEAPQNGSTTASVEGSEQVPPQTPEANNGTPNTAVESAPPVEIPVAAAGAGENATQVVAPIAPDTSVNMGADMNPSGMASPTGSSEGGPAKKSLFEKISGLLSKIGSRP